MAIIDRREITFDIETLTTVFSSHVAVESLGLPDIAPSIVELDTRGQQVTVHYRLSRGTRSIPLRLEALGALLISYCIRCRLPIPRKAGKGIYVSETGVIVSFQTRLNDQETRRKRIPIPMNPGA